MDLWGATAFSTTLALAVYDAGFTIRVMRKYGVVAETNPGVVWLATVLGVFGVYVATILPTATLLVAVTLAQSKLGLGFLLGARLCLFRFQQMSKRLQSQMDALKSAEAKAPPPPSPDAS